jgi:hypothetical protein
MFCFLDLELEGGTVIVKAMIIKPGREGLY